jgi:hypothetical protein
VVTRTVDWDAIIKRFCLSLLFIGLVLYFFGPSAWWQQILGTGVGPQIVLALVLSILTTWLLCMIPTSISTSTRLVATGLLFSATLCLIVQTLWTVLLAIFFTIAWEYYAYR